MLKFFLPVVVIMFFSCRDKQSIITVVNSSKETFDSVIVDGPYINIKTTGMKPGDSTVTKVEVEDVYHDAVIRVRIFKNDSLVTNQFMEYFDRTQDMKDWYRFEIQPDLHINGTSAKE